ncbi:unnamed protein product [Urochloa humidicola]
MSTSEVVSEYVANVILETCWPVVHRHLRLICFVLMPIAVVTVVAIALAAAFAVVRPVTATVEAASLSRLAPPANNNGTTTTYEYGLTLTVALRNPNVALRALHAAPLEADIRVAGRRFGSAGGFRLADAGEKLHAKDQVEYRVEAAGTVAAADVPPLGSVVPVEVALAGEVTYRPFHRGRHALAANCALQLQLPPPPGATQLAPVFHPIKCVRA